MVTFFIDRSMGERMVPTALREAGWSVVTMAERYGREAGEDKSDPDWIRDAADNGEAIITKDKMIAKRPIEAQTIFMCESRVFTLTTKGIQGPEMARRFIEQEATIMRWCRKTGPFVAALHESRIERVRLNYP